MFRNQQLPLPGFDEALRWLNGFFFAIFPGARTATRVLRLAESLRCEHGLTGKLHREDRLHVTLHYLGVYAGYPQSVVRMASEVASSLAMAPFEVAFDRVGSFDRRSPKRPFVLRSASRNAELYAFRRTLGVALAKKGFVPVDGKRWNPHVTLLYDQRRVAEHAVETVRWTVEEFALVRSLIGQTSYEVIGKWPLSV